MKKIITLLLSAGIFTATYAQENHGHNNKHNGNDQYAGASHGRYDNRNHDRDDRNKRDEYQQGNRSYAYQRQMQIDRINREYSYRVMSIQHNRYMNNRQKRLAIRDAKKERNYQIQMINRKMNGYANNSHGRDNNYGKHYDGDRR